MRLSNPFGVSPQLYAAPWPVQALRNTPLFDVLSQLQPPHEDEGLLWGTQPATEEECVRITVFSDIPTRSVQFVDVDTQAQPLDKFLEHSEVQCIEVSRTETPYYYYLYIHFKLTEFDFTPSTPTSVCSSDFDLSTARIPWIPDGVDPKAVTLHEEIAYFHQLLQLTETEIQTRRRLKKKVEDAIQENWPNAKVQGYGSFSYGLSLPHGDIDLNIFVSNTTTTQGRKNSSSSDGDPKNSNSETESSNSKSTEKNEKIPPNSPQEGLKQCVPLLEKLGIQCKPLLQATVPVVKMIDSVLGARCDLTWSDPAHPTGGIESVRIVKLLLQKYDTAVPLILLLKTVLRQRDMNEPREGGLSSFGLTLLVLAYLQTYTPIKGSTCSYSVFEQPRFHKCTLKHNGEDLGELIADFLCFYATKFDWNSFFVTIYPMANWGCYPPLSTAQIDDNYIPQPHTWVDRSGHVKRILVIQNPNNYKHNVASNAFQAEDIIVAWREIYYQLREWNSNKVKHKPVLNPSNPNTVPHTIPPSSSSSSSSVCTAPLPSPSEHDDTHSVVSSSKSSKSSRKNKKKRENQQAMQNMDELEPVGLFPPYLCALNILVCADEALHERRTLKDFCQKDEGSAGWQPTLPRRTMTSEQIAANGTSTDTPPVPRCTADGTQTKTKKKTKDTYPHQLKEARTTLQPKPHPVPQTKPPFTPHRATTKKKKKGNHKRATGDGAPATLPTESVTKGPSTPITTAQPPATLLWPPYHPPLGMASPPFAAPRVDHITVPTTTTTKPTSTTRTNRTHTITAIRQSLTPPNGTSNETGVASRIVVPPPLCAPQQNPATSSTTSSTNSGNTATVPPAAPTPPNLANKNEDTLNATAASAAAAAAADAFLFNSLAGLGVHNLAHLIQRANVTPHVQPTTTNNHDHLLNDVSFLPYPPTPTLAAPVHPHPLHTVHIHPPLPSTPPSQNTPFSTTGAVAIANCLPVPTSSSGGVMGAHGNEGPNANTKGGKGKPKKKGKNRKQRQQQPPPQQPLPQQQETLVPQPMSGGNLLADPTMNNQSATGKGKWVNPRKQSISTNGTTDSS